MASDGENLVLEHLRHIRKAVDDLRLDMSDVKSRMTAVELTMGQIISLLATQSGRMDRIEDRLGRVERRLDLTMREAAPDSISSGEIKRTVHA